MVVYLYKKGRQTMKNIITTIAMFILTITAQAQIVTVKADSFYHFKHSLDISTDEAVQTKNYTFIDYKVGQAEFKFDEVNKMVSITFYDGSQDFAFIDSMSKFDNGEINYFVTFGKSNLKGYYSLSSLRKRNVLWCGYYNTDKTMGNWSSVIKDIKID
jgi:hypothetical protein